jgi:hypothetical protein
VLGLVIGACSAGADKEISPATSSNANTLNAPLPAADPEAFRMAEAAMRREGRAQAGLSKLGPGALKLAELMDRTASFALTHLPAKLRVAVTGAPIANVDDPSGRGGRLAAPLFDLPQPGEAVLGAYLITTQAADAVLANSQQAKASGECPCTTTGNSNPYVDNVDIEGNPGLITTTTSYTGTITGSKMNVDITVRVAGEVRDAATKAILYKIANEGKGHVDGDACPDPSGTVRAHMLFSGHEDYFNDSGAVTGGGVSESFGGEMRIRVDDSARIAGVDISPVGKGGEFMMRLAAQSTAPSFEKVWRTSGVCIALLATPEGGPVEKDSETTVTVKVKHAQEGNELDKLVEARFDGVKSLEPKTKQKGPAEFRYKAGSTDGDKGSIAFESVSNRGIGRTTTTFTVGGDWSVTLTGTSVETVASLNWVTSVKVSFKDVKVTTQKDFTATGVGRVVRGTGNIMVAGSFQARMYDTSCSAPIDRTFPFELVGSVNGPVMKLKVNAPPPASEVLSLTCSDSGTFDLPQPAESNFFAFTLGEIELPVEGGARSFDRSATIALAQVKVNATVTIVALKP